MPTFLRFELNFIVNKALSFSEINANMCILMLDYGLKALVVLWNELKPEAYQLQILILHPTILKDF